jgi:multidrug efflux system membrane fusion protein
MNGPHPPEPLAPTAAIPAAPLRRARTMVVGGLALGAFAALGWLVVSRANEAGVAPADGGRRGGRVPAVVVVASARTADVPEWLEALGTVTPQQTVTVRPRVDGQLLRVEFEEGQTVVEGQSLAQIDARPFEVQRAQADGQLARDQALLANANVDLERYRVLLAQESVEQQKFDAQKSLVAQLEGTVRVDQSLVDNADLQIGYAHITAPLAGRVGLRLVDAGNIVHAGDAAGIVVITQMEPIDVTFSIPQDHLPRVVAQQRAGAPLTVEAYDRQQRQLLATGHLRSIDNQIDAIGTLHMKATFANGDGRLFPSQFVNVRLLVDTLRGATVVPTAALQLGATGTFVYVVDNEHKVSVRAVTKGPDQGESTAIVEGLAVGENVVVDGADRLRDGMTVTTTTADERSEAGKGQRGGDASARTHGGHRGEVKK